MSTDLPSQKRLSLEELQKKIPNTMIEHLGIKFTHMSEECLEATMPVDHRTHQIEGILHGGASVVLAETLGSVGSYLFTEPDQRCVGLDINANHLRPVAQGEVRGVAKPIHIGRKTHIWEIKIYDERQKLVCISRLTVAVIPS